LQSKQTLSDEAKSGFEDLAHNTAIVLVGGLKLGESAPVCTDRDRRSLTLAGLLLPIVDPNAASVSGADAVLVPSDAVNAGCNVQRSYAREPLCVAPILRVHGNREPLVEICPSLE